MFENLSYKYIRIIVIVAFLLALLLGYKRFFKRTINLINTYQIVNEEDTDSITAIKKIKEVEQAINQLESITGSSSEEPDVIQQKILSFTSSEHKSLKINSLNEIHSFKEEDFTVYSNFVTVEGDYNIIINYIYNLEQKFDASRVSSVKLYKKKKLGKKEKLYARVTFQNYKAN